ncbi:hypothetical protein KR059_011714, partial [Drosophila kikkawai]
PQQMDDPPSLPVGTEVSAKYKGAFCEAKVSKVVRNIKVKVAYKQGLGSGIVSDDAIKAPTGQLRVGAVVEVRHPDRKEIVEATITKIQDCSQYTVVFDDGDITTLRRTALCLKSGRHFNESETLDQLPLTHPEHFGNPVVGGRRGRRRGQLNEDSSDDDDESDAKEVVNEKEENIGKVVCVETESKKKDKEKWFPALVVAPTAQATVRIRVKDEYLVRSFKDGRYYTVPKKEATEFTREVASKQDVPAVQAALEFLDSSILPPHWDRDSLFGLSNLSSDDEGEIDSDSSDDEPHEEKDRFVAQLYKYMDDRGTPLNKVPSIQSRDVDLYRLFRAVQKRGGYNRVTSQNQWKLIAVRLGFTPCTVSVMNLVKQAYKKFLQPYGDFHRKLGCSMLMTSRNSNRSKGRSLVRANSVASPKPTETTKTETISKLAQPNQTNVVVASTSTAASSSSAAAASAASTPVRAASTASQSAVEVESEDTSESSVVVDLPPAKKHRKGSSAASSNQQGKVKTLVEKYEEKSTAAQAGGGGGGGAAATAGTSGSTAVPATPVTTGIASTSSSTTTTNPSASSTFAPATPGSAGAISASGAFSKDTESDLPLAKIKAAAAAAAAAATRNNSMEKETNISSGSSASASSKANSAEMQSSRDASPSVSGGPPSVAASSSSIAPAASAQPSSTKKEKHQRAKQADKDKDKEKDSNKDNNKDKDKDKDKEEKQPGGSGKRKKEKISVEKIDTGDFVVGIGDKLKVNYHEKKSPSSHGSTYEAKVIEISVQRGVPMYLVHYTGWNNRYDEWVPRERIAENLTKGSKQKTRTISTSSANSGSGGGGGGGGGGGVGSLSVQGSLPPGVAEKQQQQQPSAKEGGSKIPPSAGFSPGSGASPLPGSLGGASSTPSLLSSTAVKTPTSAGAKRGRGRSDSMPPRSTTPSSVVVSAGGRTKSPAASQGMKKRPTRILPGTTTSRRTSDASMATESDSDSDEPVRRPKRQQLAKDKTQAGKQQQQSKGRVASSASSTVPPREDPSEDSEEEDEEEEHPPKQQQQSVSARGGSRAGGNRAMSSGAASAKGRDYDLSEIRSELKGFQPQLLTNSQPNEDRKKEAAIKTESLSSGEPSTLLQDVVKKEPGKLESLAKSRSSTEMSSETESYADEDSQSSDYRKQPKGAAGKREPTTSSKLQQDQSMPKREAVKEEPQLKVEPKAEPKTEEDTKSKPPFLSGADIKPTTLIAPARFGNSSAAGGSGSATPKYTSVIVEKLLTFGGKKSGGGGAAGTAEQQQQHLPVKKAAATTLTAGGSQESKKFAEPVASLKVELPAACSPSSSSSSSSSFCSSGSGSGSSSSATRSLPDMSKLEISSGTGGGVGAGATSAVNPASSSSGTGTSSSSGTSVKESKYSSSSGAAGAAAAAGGSGLTMRKLLSSDVYEFKDTEPFEFEKRISPMTSVGASATGTAGPGAGAGTGTAAPGAVAASVITAVLPPAAVAGTGVSGTGSTTAMAASTGGVPVVVSSVARKQALKASAMQHSLEVHQLHQPSAAASSSSAASSSTGSSSTAGYSSISSGISTAAKPKKRGSPLKEAGLGLEKGKNPKLDRDQVQQVETKPQQQLTPPSIKVPSSGAGAQLTPSAAVTNPVKMHTPPGAGVAAGGANTTVIPAQLTPHHATPFDALRKSPSFNLNITALNEELAQTVQETTRALTDALQPPPTTPVALAVPTPGIPMIAPSASASTLSCPGTPPTGSSSSAASVSASPKLSTPPQAPKQPATSHIVGSPFIETRNVFELSTSNEGSGYSSGESKDNKLEKLENVKILLAGAAGPFDLDAGSYEQKTSSIADKVLKAISQKKEEVENSKGKPSAVEVTTKASPPEDIPPPKLEPSSSSSSHQAIKLDTLKLLSEPLKIQTGPLLGELYRPGPATSSPETKSILESSLPAKNSELSETIQKLECAIQQRKTPVGGAHSLASSNAGTPPTAHTPNSTATAGPGFSDDESIDSTDSEQRLVIEDVIAEEHTTTTTTGEQKSPGSGQEEGQTTATIVTAMTSAETEATSSRSNATPPVSAPVKLELGGKALPGIQAPIPLKLTEGGGSSFAGKLTAVVTQPPPLAKLQPTEEATKTSLSSFGIPIVVPEIPASVVVATPALMVASGPDGASGVMRPSPGSTSNSPAAGTPVLISPKAFQAAPKVGEASGGSSGGLLLKTYTGVGGSGVVTTTVVAPVVPSNFAQQQGQQQQHVSSVLQAASEMPGGYIIDPETGGGGGGEVPSSSPVVARPFVMHAVGKEMFNVAAPASSPLISDPHNDQSINLLCEETIPGSPAPNYGGKEEQSMPAAALTLVPGVTPLPSETPPAIGTTLQQPQTQQVQPQSSLEAVNPSATNSSPDSASQEDESGEETMQQKKPELGHDSMEDSMGLSKRKRTRKQVPMGAQVTAGVAAQLQSLGKRRRQVSGMRSQKTATTGGGSDTDDNSDNLVPMAGQQQQQQQVQQRQSARHQLMLPQGSSSTQLQQQQQQLQQQLQQSIVSNQSGVRPCPYNFLVELDPALSSDECITILRKQIQDLRKAYNTIKGELVVIDRRRKKLRRREREKKQQQMQSQQQQSKLCA